MLATFGDHNPSRSELYNNGPLNVEKLLCGQYFVQNDRKLTRATNFISRFYAFYVIKFESKQFCEIFVVNSLNY